MASLRIGSLFGIPIKLDITFLLVLPLFAYLIGSQLAPLVDMLALFGRPIDLGSLAVGNSRWLLGLLAAVGLFVGVILHELGHSLMAMRFGFSIDSITLWIFGGIARFTDMPEDWRQELLIALAGPAVSVVLGVGCYALFTILPTSQPAWLFIFGYLAVMNIVLAIFNLMPGFPMDGGRVLRALLARNRPYEKATKTAADVGKVFAILLGLFGLLGLNIILIGIAFFIYVGASSESQQMLIKSALQGIQVKDIMTPARDVQTVTPETSVAKLIDQMFHQRHTGYPVRDGGGVVGMVTLEDARTIDSAEREAMTVADVMSSELNTIGAESDAMEAIELLQRNNIGRLIVLNDRGEMVGLLSRTDLMTAFDILQTSGSRPIGRRVELSR